LGTTNHGFGERLFRRGGSGDADSSSDPGVHWAWVGVCPARRCTRSWVRHSAAGV